MNTNPETAILLVGGTANFNGFSISPCPKALLPIANRPLYYYLERALSEVGVKKIILCAKPGMGELVKARLSVQSPKMEYLVRETTMGSAGTLREVEDILAGKPFWLANGDLIVGAELNPLLALHRQQKAQATVAVLPVLEAAWEKERVELDFQKGVKAIHRIHPAQERRSMMRPAGLYLFEPEVLEFIPRDGYFDLKEQLFPILHEKGMIAVTWEINGYARTISSLDDYFFSNLDVLVGRAEFPDLPNAQAAPGPNNGHRPKIHPSAKLYSPFAIRPETRLGEDVLVLGPSAIGQGCDIEPNSIINECIILDGAKIGQGAYLSRCIVGEGAQVRKGALLYETALTKSPEEKGGAEVLQLREPTHRDPQAACKHLSWKTPAGPFYLKIKRVLDIILSSIFLVIAAPLMAAITVAIKMDSPGPVLFRQRRSGLKGRDFSMLKFRSMVSNAEDIKRELLMELNEVDGPMFKILEDPRITRVGKFLRDTNLDELPQLFCVLKGDMSLVGPRPLSFDEMRYNPRWRDARLAVRPGVTGLWQVEAHTKLEFNEWIRQDLDYVHNVSMALDLKILYRTLTKALSDLIHTITGRPQ
jgi:lipopolysaccharide/colanic/teichoic acid biosynthesis glycosyltransferase/acetyltransferase-like isoleucine patch superfamily enzyme